jgi:hypothetical protein
MLAQAGLPSKAAEINVDNTRQGDKLAGKSAGTRLVLVSVGGGRRGPSAGAG